MSSFDGPTEEFERHESPKKDFFISYSGKDINVVAWLNQTLEEAGYTTVMQMRDFPTGTDFVANINDAFKTSERVIAVISNNYLNSKYTTAELNTALALSWREGKNILVPILIENIDFIAHYNIAAPIAYLDISAILDDPVAASSLIKERMHQLVTSERLPSVFELPLRISPAPTIPPKYYEKLFGREKDLKAVVEAINGTTKIVAICGEAGVGKTALATEVVAEFNKTAEFDSKIWINTERIAFLSDKATRISNPITSYDEILNKIGFELGLTLPEDIIHKEAILSRVLAARKALIVIDGIDGIDNYEVILDRLFQISGSSKILTTYAQHVSHPMAESIRLHGLNPYDTLEYIRDYAEKKNLTTLLEVNFTEVNRIIIATSGLPLAVNLALGQIDSGMPLNLVLEGLETGRSKTVEKLYTYLFEDSWKALSESAQKLLICSSVGSALSIDLISEISGIAGIEVYEALDELAKFNLIQIDQNSGIQRIHLQSIVKNFLNTKVEDNIDLKETQESYNKNFPLYFLRNLGNLSWDMYQLENILEAIDYSYVTGDNEVFLQLFTFTAMAFELSVLGIERLSRYYQRAYALTESYPDFKALTIKLELSRATSYYKFGLYPEAEYIFKDLIAKADVNGSQSEKLVPLEALASIKIETERLEEAIMFYEEVIAVATQLDGEQVHINFAQKHMRETAYNFYLQLISDHEEEKIDDQELLSTIDRAIALFEKTNRSTVEIAKHLSAVGYDLLDYYKEYYEADPRYRDNLYDVTDVSDLDNARELILKAVDISKNSPSLDTSNLAANFISLGEIEFLLNNRTNAKKYLHDSLDLFKEIKMSKDRRTDIYSDIYEILWKIALQEEDQVTGMYYAKRLIALGRNDYEVIQWIEKHSEQ